MDDSGHIFISYKTEERELAFKVRDRIQAWGHTTWLDVDRLQAGTYWANHIDRALKTCRACVGIVTPLSLGSRYITARIRRIRGLTTRVAQHAAFIKLLRPGL